MKKENQVASVEPSKELRELGVKQDSVWFWNKYITSRLYLSAGKQFEDELATDGTYIQYSASAFTVAELGEMLPASIRGDLVYYQHMIKTKKTKYFNQPDYYVAYVDISNSHYLHSERDDKEADARAKMLIYLIKEGIIKVGDIK